MSSFNPDHFIPKSVVESSLTGLKLHVRDGNKILGASRRSTYTGWIKIYLTGPDNRNLIIRDDEETLAYLREHEVPIEDARNIDSQSDTVEGQAQRLARSERRILNELRTLDDSRADRIRELQALSLRERAAFRKFCSELGENPEPWIAEIDGHGDDGRG
jgi:hypothetical protein